MPPSVSVLLINPNISAETTAMMAAIGRRAAPSWLRIETATAARGAAMIVDERALALSAEEVVRIGLAPGPDIAGLIVAAFGDPGLDALKERGRVAATGLCEASMREAAEGGRRFGVATVTPGLVAAIGPRAAAYGFSGLYGGVRLTCGDPLALARDPAALREGLAEAIEQCIRLDGAEAVIIGGGPLAEAASALRHRFTVPIVEPVPAAVRRIAGLLEAIRR